MISHLLFVLFLFPIKLSILPFSSSRLVIIFCLTHFIFNATQYKCLVVYFKKFLIPILILSFISLLSNVRNDRLDLTVFINIIEIFIFYPMTAIFLINRMGNVSLIESLLRIRFAIYFQIIFIYLMVGSEDFKGFYLGFVNSGVPEYHYPIRHVGLTGFAAYNMGLFLNLIVFVEFILIAHGINLNTLRALIMSIFVLIPSLLLSRTGFIIPVLFFCFFLFLKKDLKYNSEATRFIKYFNSIFFLAPFVLVSVSLVLIEMYPFLEWALDPILSISRGDIPEGASVLADQYWYPGLLSLGIGEGYFSNELGGYYLDTDGGYMRLILFFGLPASFVLYATIINLFMYMMKLSKHVKYVSQLILVILVSIFIVQYKGNILFDGSELIKIVIILGFSGLLFTRKVGV